MSVLFLSNFFNNSLISTSTDTIFADASPGVIYSEGNDTIIGGSGPLTVYGFYGQTTVFAGSGGLTFNGGSQYDTVVGNGNPITVYGGRGGGTYYGGGNSTIYAGGHKDVLIGASGDSLSSGTSSNDLMGVAAGAGNVTMADRYNSGSDVFFGAAGTGPLTFITGDGNDVLALGQGVNKVNLGSGFAYIFGNTGNTAADTITSGTGSAAILVGGQSMNLLLSKVDAMAREFDLYGFNVGPDKISLSNYAPGEAAAAIAGQITTPGGTIMHLSDGTTISLVGVAHATTDIFG